MTRWLAVWLSGCCLAAQSTPVNFNRDIRPVMADTCFRCHGFDEKARKAKLRLDVREDALKPTKSGEVPIVPGKPEQSELIRRILTTSEDDRMPPESIHKPLTTEQKELFRRWIAEGAEYQAHWAFIKPAEVVPPKVKLSRWVRTPVDNFILARLELRNWQPARETDKRTLLRRVSLDLTGIPPTPAEVDAFLADHSPRAYETVVDRLLASPRYGERMAQDWLDAARYADSNGYQVDRDRELWAWRDWVIEAFNQNMPFDQFTVEQLAGDLLPDARLAQKIATGFNRNCMINEEGGIIPEEFLAEYCADRVETTSTVWLGLTMGCARCHDHKYDPLTQKDYYSLVAFFHNVTEKGVGDYSQPIRRNTPPFVKLPAPEAEAKLAALRRDLEKASRRLAKLTSTNSPDYAALTNRIARLKKQTEETDLTIPVTLVMAELSEPRPTFVLLRGDYDKKGDRVSAITPSQLPPFPSGQPTNRLGLARWLVSPDNPLTARVTVNRLWQSAFGSGLVRTTEDFGTRGELPSHPELLDWLANEFVRTGWDVKRMMKLLVMSGTYRQDSRVTPELRTLDPDNRLLARGPRYRLSAEAIRDQALAVSGLLVEKVGGPSVKPYHPEGLYQQVTSGLGTTNYVPGQGADLYRRSLYTYWKRSVPNPAMLVFDAPFRETCTVRRSRTTTPLQALNLLNDPTYVEASRFLAQRMMREGGSSPESRIRLGFRLVADREPRPAELRVLVAGWRRMESSFRPDRSAAEKLLAVGETKGDPTLDVVELAAYATVASTLLNLDETLTKE